MKTRIRIRSEQNQILCIKKHVSVKRLRGHEVDLFVLGTTGGTIASNVITYIHNYNTRPFYPFPGAPRSPCGSRWRYVRRLFKTNTTLFCYMLCYMLSQNVMPLLLAYQFCSCWKRSRRSKVTQGVILMGPVMRVDRLSRGGGWALKRCCLQIGFLQVRHPRSVISPSEQPLSCGMICY